MSEHEKIDIEDQLRAMRPAHPGSHLRERIGVSLDRQRVRHDRVGLIRPRLWVGLAVAAAVALMGLIVVQVINLPGGVAEDALTSPSPLAHSSEEPTRQMLGPTLLAVNHALRESPEQAESLFNQVITNRSAFKPRVIVPPPTPLDARHFEFKEEKP